MSFSNVDLKSLDLPRGLYYALPLQLIQLVAEPHRELLDCDQCLREQKNSEASEKLKCVAFRAGSLVNHRFLGKEIERGLEPLLEQLNVENPQDLAAQFYETIEQNHRFCQGYCGWLVSNEEFLQELDQQIEVTLECRLTGLPQSVYGKPHGATELENEAAESVRDWRAFLQKWRLQMMDTADLPRPFEPQFTPSSVFTGQLPPGLAAPVIPDIYPIKGKGTIVSQIESIRFACDDHLADWKTLISSATRSTKRVDSFGRQYQLQHYWRVLTQRYPEDLSRKRMKLQELFASYFDVEIDSIKRDLKAMQAVLERPLSDSL